MRQEELMQWGIENDTIKYAKLFYKRTQNNIARQHLHNLLALFE